MAPRPAPVRRGRRPPAPAAGRRGCGGGVGDRGLVDGDHGPLRPARPGTPRTGRPRSTGPAPAPRPRSERLEHGGEVSAPAAPGWTCQKPEPETSNTRPAASCSTSGPSPGDPVRPAHRRSCSPEDARPSPPPPRSPAQARLRTAGRSGNRPSGAARHRSRGTGADAARDGRQPPWCMWCARFLEPVVLAGNRLDDPASRSSLASREKLLGDDRGLELALGGRCDVLESQPPHRPVHGPRARAESTSIGAKELRPLVALRHHRDDPLPRERVPDEDHASLVRRDEVTAVRDRADVEGVPLTDEGPPAWRLRPPAAPHWLLSAAVVAGLRGLLDAVRVPRRLPRTTAAGTARRSPSPRVRTQWLSSRNAVWLCRICSQRRPTTYSGCRRPRRRAGSPSGSTARSRRFGRTISRYGE